MPLKGKPQSFQSPKLTGVRRWFVPGFNKCLVFYCPIKGGIELLRVLHGMQDVDTVMNDE
jgi:hypothetical protein